MKNTDLTATTRKFILEELEKHFTMDNKGCFYPQGSFEWQMIENAKKVLKSEVPMEFDEDREDIVCMRDFAGEQCYRCLETGDEDKAQKFLDVLNELLDYYGFETYESLNEWRHDTSGIWGEKNIEYDDDDEE